ncbi:MAG: hypothetical protein F6K48_28785 [Okeania sp. SIO3H1]|uniref:hypothetical protein n=1 Tax=Okeania sp. SIO1I7 TaxID=2607772 RepID=UPI0013CD9808|nr:hypothetical protein [Okeania sp. SIO1I7]NEN92680.1 hypothetical protein [Okeania sp. SIO3H1]NET27532.1 hypothetical protein [Okeania sp. SIO1I7]
MFTKTRVSSQADNSNGQKPSLDLSDISLLSIGTGRINYPYPFDYKTVNSWGLIDWAKKIPDIFLAAPAEFQEKITRQLILGLTKHQRYLRVNLDIEVEFPIDDPNIIKKLLTAYKNKKDSIEYLDFTDMEDKTGKLEDVVNSFIDKNHGDSDEDFENRY